MVRPILFLLNRQVTDQYIVENTSHHKDKLLNLGFQKANFQLPKLGGGLFLVATAGIEPATSDL